MAEKRRVLSRRIILKDGTALNVRMLDSLLIDDLLIQGMKAEGFRVMTGRDVFPSILKKVKDYLIRQRVITK